MLPQKQNSIVASSLEAYFQPFAQHVIGRRQFFESPFGRNRVIYADWTASGRGYGPIEKRLQEEVLPFFANTHTGTTVTGRAMTAAYEEASAIIKEHVHADAGDALLFCGSGMTDAVCRLQRMLGFRTPKEDTVIFVTHMEHHSNHISWLETGATVEVIKAGPDGNVDPGHLRQLLVQYRHRRVKIAAVTACSNVTGIQTPYHIIARLMHAVDGYCFVDFASSAPYVSIDMHPELPGGDLDAIYFSCHKFLGGPGTPGVLVFNKRLYRGGVPDRPGGGTILYSNPWGGRAYVSAIEQREDGGTPAILQAIKAALCVRLKQEMGVEQLLRREDELLETVFDRLPGMPGVRLLEAGYRRRLGIVSFMVAGAHYNLIVKILDDRFGIQTRGGCSCAGPYGHWLLGIDEVRSRALFQSLRAGDLSCKPGWVRLSLHPTMSDEEIGYILDAIEITIERYPEWKADYAYDPATNEFVFRGREQYAGVGKWFSAPLR
jgi:selenocysteine lyase/cysteine desulfurase